MHTADLIAKLLDEDEGRWRVANHGQSIDEYYLRSELKGYVHLGQGIRGGDEAPPVASRGFTDSEMGLPRVAFCRTPFCAILGRDCPRRSRPRMMRMRPPNLPLLHPLNHPAHPAHPDLGRIPLIFQRHPLGWILGWMQWLGKACIQPSISTKGLAGPGPDGGGVSSPVSSPAQVTELSPQVAVVAGWYWMVLDVLGGSKKRKNKDHPISTRSGWPKGPEGLIHGHNRPPEYNRGWGWKP